MDFSEQGALPLKAAQKIAVVGPSSVAQFGLLSDYCKHISSPPNPTLLVI